MLRDAYSVMLRMIESFHAPLPHPIMHRTDRLFAVTAPAFAADALAFYFRRVLSLGSARRKTARTAVGQPSSGLGV